MSFDYDDADRVTHQTLPDSRQISFTYDPAGNVTSVTPPSRPAHAFTFTPVDLLDTYTPPSVANATATRTSYTWNRDKQVTSVTRPDGALLSFGYDTAGRLFTLTEPLGVHHYTYGASGTLAGIAAPDGNSVAFTYDGDLPTGVVSTGAVSASVGFSYDSSFRMTGETVNGTSTIAFGYDDDDLLITAGALTLHRDTTNGLLTGTTLGNITDSYTYNTFGEPTSYSVQLNAATIFTLGYTRDDAGRIANRTETVNGTTTLTSYTYDDAGRLTDVNTAGAITHYGYDANGNRTSVDSPTGTISATYDAQDRLVTYNGASYFYSDNGDLQKKIDSTGTTTYAYDVLGNLRHVTLPDGTLIDYLIDAMNRRVGKKVNGTLTTGWIYSDALHIVAETDGAAAVTKRFVYGLRGNSPLYMIYGGVTYRLLSDERGSIRYVVDVASGTVAQAFTYEAWGEVLSDTRPAFQPFGFAGGLYDTDTKLARFGARDYDAHPGRWTANDPIRFDGGQSNLYEYVQNDPVNATDRTGLWTEAQCRAAKEMIRRERQYGRYKTAVRSSNTIGDQTLLPFDADFGNNPNFRLADGSEIDIDWFTDITAFSGGGGLAPYAYGFGKTVWWLSRIGDKQGRRNAPFEDPGERGALNQVILGTTYEQIFSRTVLERECGCAD